MLKVHGKSKFKHFLYDIGLRNALAVSFFTLCLVTSIIVPLTTFLALLLFWIAYNIDKYNMFFVYPLDFESCSVNRRTLVIYTLEGIIFFQVVMVWLCSSMLTIDLITYLSAAIFFQVILIVSLFECIRKPWKGLSCKVEQAENV